MNLRKIPRRSFEGAVRLFLENARKYLRVEVHGIENVPQRGRALIAPNHSGCAGLDAVMLGHMLHQKTPRIPRILAMWGFFRLFPFLAPLAQSLGLKPASTESGTRLLAKNNLVVCFPEGEAGSFKPSSQAYRLQPFRTGFVRMALVTGAPIVPCLIIGAEESNINLGTVKLGKRRKATLVPVPFNVFPLPAKWDIRFLPPIDLSEHSRHADDKAKLQELADLVRARMQAALEAELSRREFVYVEPSAS